MAFSVPLPVSCSSLLSSSEKKQGSKMRRKNSKKTPIVVVITTATTQKKQVRFQLPSDSAAATTTTTTTGNHPDCSRGRPQHCRTKGPSKRTAKNVHNSTIWYTAKELKSFRTDIELTIQWIITKGIIDDTERGRDGRKILYSKKKMKDEKASMYWKMLYLEHYQHYPFCAQGVECWTPLGQFCKKKRRKEATRSVLTLQQQQTEQRNNTERSTQTTTQMNNTNDDDDDDIADRNATALANIYALSCQESCSLALHRGRRNAAVDKGRVATRSSSSSSSFLLSGTKEEEEQEPPPHWQQQQKQKQKKREENKKKTTMLLRSSSITLAYQYHNFCDDMVSLHLLLNKSLMIGGKE